MKIIAELVSCIHQEIASAEDCAKKAVHYKDADKYLADNYARMAEAKSRSRQFSA